MAASQRKPSYRVDIDGMRAFAVVAVIVNHFHHATLQGGYLGVDVFFVISGFVITKSLDRADIPRLAEQLAVFYSRRMRRLLPALLTWVLIASA